MKGLFNKLKCLLGFHQWGKLEKKEYGSFTLHIKFCQRDNCNQHYAVTEDKFSYWAGFGGADYTDEPLTK